MVHLTAEYLGGFACRAVHGPSGAEMRTDAPADIGGGGSTFSPTDLVGAALLTCMMTTMAMVAERSGVKLDGMTGAVEKIMRTTSPRRIDQLKVRLKMPIAADHAAAQKLMNAAEKCPVHISLHPEIIQTIEFEWAA
jgi:uncharacterized OsmC-like protein